MVTRLVTKIIITLSAVSHTLGSVDGISAVAAQR